MLDEITGANMSKKSGLSNSRKDFDLLTGRRFKNVLKCVDHEASRGRSWIIIPNTFRDAEIHTVFREMENRGFIVRLLPNRIEIRW